MALSEVSSAGVRPWLGFGFRFGFRFRFRFRVQGLGFRVV